MTALLIHELRLASRHWSWPIALLASAVGSAAFVAIWGPDGVPLWSASLLTQLVVGHRLIIAVATTWLATDIMAPTSDAALPHWSAVSARRPAVIIAARMIACSSVSVALSLVSLPSLVIAQHVSNASTGDLVWAAMSGIGFSMLAVGIASATSVAVTHRIHGWICAMFLCGIAAVGTRALPAGLMRAVAPAMAAAAAMTLSAALAERRWVLPLRERR